MSLKSTAALALAFALLAGGCSSDAQPIRAKAPGEVPAATEKVLSPSAQASTASSQPTAPVEEEKPQPVIDGPIWLSSPKAAQGDIFTILVEGDEESVITATSTLGFTPKFFYSKEAGRWGALLPTSYKITPAEYTLTVTVDGIVHTFPIEVVKKDFAVQYLTVNQSTVSATVENDAANAEWDKTIEPLKWISDSQQYWVGKFQQPVIARVSTEYGSTRYTNGSTVPSFHGGTDFAANRGTQAVAANNGRILFAGFLKLTGNTVVIEHGYGLKSFYYHMDSLDTTTGAQVKTGDPIGKVGSTGFSTGPHLHYALLVNNIFIDPMTAFSDGIPAPLVPEDNVGENAKTQADQ